MAYEYPKGIERYIVELGGQVVYRTTSRDNATAYAKQLAAEWKDFAVSVTSDGKEIAFN